MVSNLIKRKSKQLTNIQRPLKELRAFLEMTGYYRRFVEDFAKIAKPLRTRLMKSKNGRLNGLVPLPLRVFQLTPDL